MTVGAARRSTRTSFLPARPASSWAMSQVPADASTCLRKTARSRWLSLRSAALPRLLKTQMPTASGISERRRARIWPSRLRCGSSRMRAALSSTALRRIPGIPFHSSSLVIDQPRHRTGSSPALRVDRRVPDLDAVVARLRSTATVSVANARDPTVPVDGAQSVQAHSAPTSDFCSNIRCTLSGRIRLHTLDNAIFPVGLNFRHDRRPGLLCGQSDPFRPTTHTHVPPPLRGFAARCRSPDREQAALHTARKHR